MKEILKSTFYGAVFYTGFSALAGITVSFLPEYAVSTSLEKYAKEHDIPQELIKPHLKQNIRIYDRYNPAVIFHEAAATAKARYYSLQKHNNTSVINGIKTAALYLGNVTNNASDMLASGFVKSNAYSSPEKLDYSCHIYPPAQGDNKRLISDITNIDKNDIDGRVLKQKDFLYLHILFHEAEHCKNFYHKDLLHAEYYADLKSAQKLGDYFNDASAVRAIAFIRVLSFFNQTHDYADHATAYYLDKESSFTNPQKIKKISLETKEKVKHRASEINSADKKYVKLYKAFRLGLQEGLFIKPEEKSLAELYIEAVEALTTYKPEKPLFSNSTKQNYSEMQILKAYPAS